jgi:quercetin dioxygenase-like cupin family protein
METAISERKIPRSINHSLSDSILSDFNLDSLIATMKQSRTWTNGELNSLILLNNPDEQIILTAVHEGTEIESFQENDSVSFQVIEGLIKFHVRKNTITIREGQLMKLDENIKYSFVAREDTVFLLTISNGIGSTVHQGN